MRLPLPLVGTLMAAIVLPVAAAPHAADLSDLRYLLTASGGVQTAATTIENTQYSGEDALILGPSGIRLPSQNLAAFFLDHYLAHPTPTPAGLVPEVAGFTGNPDNVVGFSTPELFTSASYLDGDADVIHELLTRYNDLLANGPDDPLYLFGYSQSATILTAVDSHLNDLPWLQYVLDNSHVLANGTGHDYAGDVNTYAKELADLSAIAPDLRLVLVGDPAAAPVLANVDNGFASSGFDNAGFTQFWLDNKMITYTDPTTHQTEAYGYGTWDGKADANVATGYVGGTGANAPVETDGYAMAGQNTNLDLSPTSVYTINGDTWAQATSFFGLPNESGSLEHDVYPGADSSEFTFENHIGNVDYFDSGSNFNLWIAAATAAITAALGMGTLSTE